MTDYEKLKRLREESGVSFSLCKKALDETNNNIENARKKLSGWGSSKAKEKTSRNTAQAAIFSYVHHNRKIASLVELQCETDFVSGNSEFQKLGQEIAMQIASLNPKSVNVLLKQEYIREPGKTINTLVKEAVLKFGENININRFIRWQS